MVVGLTLVAGAMVETIGLIPDRDVITGNDVVAVVVGATTGASNVPVTELTIGDDVMAAVVEVSVGDKIEELVIEVTAGNEGTVPTIELTTGNAVAVLVMVLSIGNDATVSVTEPRSGADVTALVREVRTGKEVIVCVREPRTGNDVTESRTGNEVIVWVTEPKTGNELTVETTGSSEDKVDVAVVVTELKIGNGVIVPVVESRSVVVGFAVTIFRAGCAEGMTATGSTLVSVGAGAGLGTAVGAVTLLLGPDAGGAFVAGCGATEFVATIPASCSSEATTTSVPRPITRLVGTRVLDARLWAWVSIAAWINPMLGKGAESGKFTKVEVFTTRFRSTSTGSGIRLASGRMITILPGRSTSESPKVPLRDKRKLPSRTRTLM